MFKKTLVLGNEAGFSEASVTKTVCGHFCNALGLGFALNNVLLPALLWTILMRQEKELVSDEDHFNFLSY